MILQSFFQTWLPFIYLYGVGGLFFFTGIYVVVKSGSLNVKKKNHRFWLITLLSGFFFFMVFHAFLIIAALYF
jgi:hypothetical protein